MLEKINEFVTSGNYMLLREIEQIATENNWFLLRMRTLS